MQIPDNIDWVEFVSDLVVAWVGFMVGIGLVILVLGLVASDEHEKRN